MSGRFGPRFARFVPRFSFIRKYPATTLCVLASAAHFVDTSLFSIYRVTGPSMSPTLSPDAHTTGERDVVLFRKDIGYLEDEAMEEPAWTQWLRNIDPKWKLQRGMIVCFWAPHNPELMATKRVVALEGDVIQPLRWPHNINDLTEEELKSSRKKRSQRRQELLANHIESMRKAEAEERKEERRVPDPVMVPFGHVWVEGDNEEKGRSRDSNDFGPLSKSMIVGVAERIVLPRRRAGKMKWEADGWERRVGHRLKKRHADKVEVPEEWVMH